ncbi:hypothetical protein [Bergeyella zoohelcum]|uniref:Uncharacterized protein n=1 Tax=Bergeyella zoohelcum TaxID=1015 RepID=A0A376BZK4_9FLAO|nr:hypothetical protein [Bergeyella zoohelcum]EKB60791.1 hypothetical protein HMPREF9700_00286 [Bergeyella zoohelcum CCUG 30536]SSZ47118.1 Uncharacterised protein [Bergeyella zoohelcum]
MEYRDELAIAKKAEQMLTSALQGTARRTFKEHFHRKEGNDSLRNAYAEAEVKEYGNKKKGTKAFMRRLSIKMEKHGFIQHYGVDTIRVGGERTRNKPKSTAYGFNAHYYNLKPKEFISEAIEQSKVIDFVASNVAELRSQKFGEELVFNITRFTDYY